MEQKKPIRKDALSIRNRLNKEEHYDKSMDIMEMVLKDSFWMEADCILLYINCGSEVATDFILYSSILSGKKVYAPKVLSDNREMDFYQIMTLEEMTSGYHGILEPIPYADRLFCYEKEIELGKKILMIMPGLGFSKDGDRLGYGMGFYDTYLSGKDKIRTIGLSFQCQIFEKIPSEVHDKKLDKIITECEVIENCNHFH